MKRHIGVLIGTLLVLSVPGGTVVAQGVPSLGSLPQCQGVAAGTVHVVNSPVGPVTSVEPPASFKPAGATDAELRCYGLMQRPSDPAQFAQWTRVLGAPHRYVVPAFGSPRTLSQTATVAPLTVSGSPVKDYYAACPVGGTCASSPWAGYAIPASKNTGWTNLQWTETWGDWTAPYGHTYCTGATSSPFVGMGGDPWDGGNANALIQAGTDTQNSSPTPETQFWWEDWNHNNEQLIPLTDISVAQGQEVFVDVKYNGNGTATFTFQNQTQYTSFTTPAEYTPNVDLSSADFIVENTPSPDYVNYDTMTFE